MHYISDETTGFWEFDNAYGLAALADTISEATARQPAGPFDARIAWLQARYSAQDLIEAAKGTR